MKAWSPIILILALTAAILLNNRETNPVVKVQPMPMADTPASKPKPKAAPAIKKDDGESEDDQDEIGTQENSTPASIAKPEEPLQPQPQAPVLDLPIWNVSKPKAANDMWTLREVVRADNSDRSVFLITYGSVPKPNFRVEPWAPSIFDNDER